MTIKHIVIRGGGPTGFIVYGALKHLIKETYLDMNNIKTIYGCSIGALFGVILSLKYDWNVLDDYLIKRPWEKIVDIGPEDIFSIFNQKGLLGLNFIVKTMQPLLEAKDLSLNVTLRELYEYNNIEIHMYAVDLNDDILKETDISYKTHPDMLLINALTATTAFPIIMRPLYIDKHCYIDGGIINNLPISNCLKQTNCDINEVLVLQNKLDNSNNEINNDSTFIHYISKIMRHVHDYIKKDSNQVNMPNTVNCIMNEDCEYYNWLNCLTTKNKREKLIDHGINCAKTCLEELIKLE